MPMRVQCDNCASSYTLPDSRLTPGRRVQFLCRHCQHRIVVLVPEQAEAFTPAAEIDTGAQTAAEPPEIMWFVVASDGQQRMSTAAVASAIAAGTIGVDTLIWRKGFAEWQRVAATADFAEAVRQVGSGRSPTPSYQPVSHAAPAPSLSHAEASVSRVESAVGQVAAVASVVRAYTSNPDHSQVAVAMPIIRPQLVEAPAPRPARGLQRLEPGQRADRSTTGAGRNSGPAPVRTPQPEAMPRGPATRGRTDANTGPGGSSRWSPATDTWTGPKGNVTRPVPEEQRQALLRQVADQDATERARVELEDALAAAQADARSWRMIAGFALAAALIAAAVAVFALVRWHAAQSALTACRPAVAAESAIKTP